MVSGEGIQTSGGDCLWIYHSGKNTCGLSGGYSMQLTWV